MLKVPWSGNQCIVCLSAGPLCNEHIIPSSLGGRLTAEFLCRPCNSRLGHKLENDAKSDPSILIAAQHLADKIPTLARSLLESHPHVAHGPNGAVSGYTKNKKFIVKSYSRGDGSIVLPTDEATKSIETILKRAGTGQSPIEQATSTLHDAPENKKIELATGLDAVKWSINRVELDLSKSPLMNPLIPAKIAFEFLACHAGEAICDRAPSLSEIRNALHSGEMNSNAIKVERLFANEYAPFHGLCFEGNNPYATVLIRLLGWLAFRVHFMHLSVGGPRFAYTLELDTSKEHVNLIDEVAASKQEH